MDLLFLPPQSTVPFIDMQNKFSFLAATVLLSGCALVPPTPPAVIEKSERLTPIPSQAESSKSIYVANVGVRLIDKRIGQLNEGWICIGSIQLLWLDNPGLISAFREKVASTLSKNGYTVHSGLIQTSAEKDADILIGVGIEDIRANICQVPQGKKGDSSMRITFEMRDNKTNNTFTFTTVGTGSIKEFSRTGDPDMFHQAVEMATENFLAQETVFKMTRKK